MALRQQHKYSVNFDRSLGINAVSTDRYMGNDVSAYCTPGLLAAC